MTTQCPKRLWRSVEWIERYLWPPDPVSWPSRPDVRGASADNAWWTDYTMLYTRVKSCRGAEKQGLGPDMTWHSASFPPERPIFHMLTETAFGRSRYCIRN